MKLCQLEQDDTSDLRREEKPEAGKESRDEKEDMEGV